MEQYKTKHELEKFARKSLSEHRYNLSINTIDEDMAFIFGFYQGAKLWIDYNDNHSIFEEIINKDGDCLMKYENGKIRRFLEGCYKVSEVTHFKRLI
jgi:hypothetical protein